MLINLRKVNSLSNTLDIGMHLRVLHKLYVRFGSRYNAEVNDQVDIIT